jgi:hypothetical protein
MDRPEPTKGDAAVLWRRWRLVHGKELYDLRTDPGQKRDVAGENPEVVRRLSEQYETWWAGIAPQVNDFSSIHVGSDAESPTLLSACDWQDVFLDQARQVRAGEHKNGAWGVVVDRPGTYEFSLRRWPEDADLAIDAPAPEHKGPDGTYPAGVPLPIRHARLKVGSVEESRSVSPGDKAVTFSLKLPKGGTQVQTWFDGDNGKPLCGAYYVYVRRLAP